MLVFNAALMRHVKIMPIAIFRNEANAYGADRPPISLKRAVPASSPEHRACWLAAWACQQSCPRQLSYFLGRSILLRHGGNLLKYLKCALSGSILSRPANDPLVTCDRGSGGGGR